LRAIEPLDGVEAMAEARRVDPEKLHSIAGQRLLTSGPGRVCEALGITRARFNGQELYRAASPLRIVGDSWRPGDIRETLRIGITKSSEMPLRYVIAGNPFVSGPRLQSRAR
jgi:DNA-3-methyladenine glycosylase